MHLYACGRRAEGSLCKPANRADDIMVLLAQIWKLNIKLPVGNTRDNKQRLANHMNCEILNRLFLIFQEVHRVHGEKRKELLSSQSYKMKIKYAEFSWPSFFFFLNLFLLGYNCFTMLCQVPLYSKMNQPYIYRYLLPFEFPFHSDHHREVRRVLWWLSH